MKTFAHMSDGRLAEILEPFSRHRIAVVGDFFLDKYLDVEPELAETSLETGKTAHQVVAVRHSPGAAGTVVSNLAALGAQTLYAVGFTGDDGESYDLRNGLAAVGCHTEHLFAEPERMTPTYLKPRNSGDPSLAGEHSRYDTKNRTPTPTALEQKLVDAIDALIDSLDAVIVLDQVEEAECGVVTTGLRNALADRARRYPKVVFWADSRRRIREFRHLFIKPNQFEALGRENPPPDAHASLDDLSRAIPRLRQMTQAPIFATRGAEGIVVSDPEPTLVPAVRLDGPTDPTGAGDSTSAGAVLALCSGAALTEAALVGNLVASITVEQLATTGTAHPGDLPTRLALWQAQQ